MIAHSGTKKSEREARQEHQPLYDIFWIGLTMPRDQLYARIDQRVDQMMQDGLLEEVRLLAKDPNIWQTPGFKGIGYKEWYGYFHGECDIDNLCGSDQEEFPQLCQASVYVVSQSVCGQLVRCRHIRLETTAVEGS